METVPVTLGAVLPGITGVPPFFAKGTVANTIGGAAMGGFLQALQSMVGQSSAGAIPAKEAAPAQQDKVEQDNDKDTVKDKKNQEAKPSPPLGFLAAALPPPATAPLLLQPTAAGGAKPSGVESAVATLPQPDGTQLKSAPLEARTFVTAQPDVNDGAQPATPAASASWLLAASETGQPKEKSGARGPETVAAPPAVMADKKLAAPEPLLPPRNLPDDLCPVQLAHGQQAEKSGDPVSAETIHNLKDRHDDRVQEKASERAAPLATPPLGPPISNLLTVAASVVSKERPHSTTGPVSLPEKPLYAPPATEVPVHTTPETEPEVRPLAVSPANPQDLQVQPVSDPGGSQPMQSFQLLSDSALSTQAAETWELQPKGPASRKAGTDSISAKAQGPRVDADLPVVKLQARIPLPAQVSNLPAGDGALSVLPPTLKFEARPQAIVRPSGHDVQHEIKPDVPPQKTAPAPDGHDAATPAVTSPPAHLAPLEPVPIGEKNASIPPQTVPAPSVSGPAAAMPSSPSSPEKSQLPVSSPSDAPIPPPLPSDRIQAARLLDRLGQAEMHLGMRTETFGSIQVHTVIRDSQVGLTIGSERGDLKTYLAAEVSGLEASLRQHDLQFRDVRFVSNSFSPGGNPYGGSGSPSQSFQQGRSFPQGTARFVLPSETRNETEAVNHEPAGLSVHA